MAQGLTKRCSSCGEVKPHEEFNRQRNKPSGLQAYCRECGRRRSREWHARNRPHRREYDLARMREAYARDPQAVLARNREWARNNPEKIRASKMRRYGLTPEGFDAMLEDQGHACLVCRTPEPGGSGTWHIDHDHACCPQQKRSCGRCVRGLLCNRCNTTLGLVKDNRETLMALIAYLDRHADR